jgi:hypothetical protein
MTRNHRECDGAACSSVQTLDRRDTLVDLVSYGLLKCKLKKCWRYGLGLSGCECRPVAKN